MIGFIAAVTAFLSIWIGHVAVRKVEAESHTLWIPTVIAITLGLAAEYGSSITDSLPLKTVLGILGVTLLWDALELTRQQKRIRKGHAPANRNNPRHARILAESNTHATTVDLLKREPSGSLLPKGVLFGDDKELGMRGKS